MLCSSFGTPHRRLSRDSDFVQHPDGVALGRAFASARGLARDLDDTLSQARDLDRARDLAWDLDRAVDLARTRATPSPRAAILTAPTASGAP